MTQEKDLKELLLKDLCARLLYGVKVNDREEIITIRAYHPSGIMDVLGIMHSIENIKPYLFPMSSMTEEQERELTSITYSNNDDVTIALFTIDWLNKNHFDYRGLIDKGLAIDATGLGIY